MADVLLSRSIIDIYKRLCANAGALQSGYRAAHECISAMAPST